jgi:glucans biosynthesis protein
MTLSRRRFLQSLAGAPSLIYAGSVMQRALADELTLKFGPAREFSFEALKERAANMAREVYLAPAKPHPEIINKIDYAAHGLIRFKPELALFGDDPKAYPATFFHLGRFFPKKVIINWLENGKARELLYSDDYFEMPKDSPAHRLGHDVGFAGFRLQENPLHNGKRRELDWVAFLGAAYFRAVEETGHYGMSARGVAIDTAVPGKTEEFPDFREFWIEAPHENDRNAIAYALLDGPSITGAYKFILTRDAGVTIEVEKHLYLRKSVSQLGIAPMSSMYWFSETRKPAMADWRPEVHDSDGLQMWTGAGERIWRPLNNPQRVITSAFKDSDPKGFGLIQRDRNFDHYLDSVYYDLRPSLWIEPLGAWEAGEVQLVEIPTDSEIHDNIVAMWVPEAKAEAGQQFSYRYKMHWQSKEPDQGGIARVVATRLGQGGRYGIDFPNEARKFLIEFEGDALVKLPRAALPEQVVTASRGEIVSAGGVEPIRPDFKIAWDEPSARWRTQFDLKVTGDEPLEMRCYLKNGNDILTETWLYQYHPKP